MRGLAKRWLLGVAAATFVAAGACERRADQTQTADTTTPARSDAAVTTSVQAKYFGDSTVKGHRIDVDTEKGVVTLTGTVENDAQKARAVQLAQQVDGVTRVEDRLRVEAPRAEARPADRPAQGDTGDMDPNEVNPGWITTKIQSQYFLSPDVKGRNIDVTTSGTGAVTLQGTVDTAAERQEAVRIARATDGVRDVTDELRVTGDPAARPDPNAPRAGDRDSSDLGDGWTTAKIQAKYFLDGDVKGHNINVTTNNNVVTLQGEVESAEQKRQAVALARATDGVTEVRDELRIVPDTDADKARTDAAGRRDSNQPVTDTWITTKIQSKYFVDRDLKARNINVTTRNGVVTLAGHVDNDAQKREAEAIARETTGVTKVDNKLAIGAAPAKK
jgi:osmotically-inducible protein OsmY